MIGDGLALNDTGFILVQATCPTFSFESVGDFIPEPRCSKFAVGLQTRRRKMRGTRGPVGLWSEEPKVTGATLCAKCLSVCSRFEPSGSSVVCVVRVAVN